MLERTAASIEPCRLQRVLPSSTSKYSLKNRPHLQPSFWQHAAPDVECLDACSALMRVPLPVAAGAAVATRSETDKLEPSLASTFVLDFLYPNGATTFLSRLRATPTPLQPFTGDRKPTTLATRLYTSSSGDNPNDNAPTGTAEEPVTSDVPEAAVSDQIEPVNQYGQPTERRSLSKVDALQAILTSEDEVKVPDRAWSLYNDLEDSDKKTFRTEVLLYCAQSARPVEAWRVCELFSSYTVKEWTDDLVEAVIRARLMFQDVSAAQAVFTQAIEKRKLGRGLEPLIVHCFGTSNWPLFLDIWALFERKMPVSDNGFVFSFKTLPSMPEFSERLVALYEFGPPKVASGEIKEQDAIQSTEQQGRAGAISNPNTRKKKVASFVRFLASNSSSSLSPTAMATILRYSKDPDTHKTFALTCIERGWNKLAIDIYNKLRRLPRVVLGDHKDLLQAVLELHYRRRDPVGMQQLLVDFKATGSTLEMKTYQRFITFYAKRGDAATVKQLIKDYLGNHKLARLDETVLSALIQVHAANGDAEGARRVIDENVALTGMPPSRVSWSILLQAYVKKRDFEGAMATFARYCEESDPDQGAFGTIMLMAGGRGDLRMTLDLLQLSADMGLKPSVPMMDAVVEAYCQNERFEEAAMLCARASKDDSIQGSRTPLWNTLLHHHARYRDLTSVNRVLDYMTKNNVPYDSHTYNSLLRALVYCNQAHHALHFIRVALRDGIFEPKEDHYVLLMSAFMRTGEKHLALKTAQALDRRFPKTAKRMTQVIRALGSLGVGTPSLTKKQRGAWGDDALQYVNRALWRFREALALDGGKPGVNHRVSAELYSQIIFALIQLRDIASVRDILSLYSLQFPDQATREKVPMELLLDMMLAEFADGNYDRVKEIFDLIVDRLEKLGRPTKLSAYDATRTGEPKQSNDTASSRLVPVVQYELCDGLKTMQRMYVAQGDAEGLMKMIKDVQRRGFKLDSKNWNYYVQALARLNRWEEAFKVCERELIATWTGWQYQRPANGLRRQLRREVLRLGDNPRRPRPISYTLLVLIKVWNDLEQLTIWAPEASKMIQKLKISCPRTVHAV
ncbi:hypothetical protein V8F20_003580, partial [Naviculisporaceae sp. PSN 640]